MADQIINIPIAKRFDPDNFVGDDVNEDTYERQPIENFGLNLL